MNIASFSSRLAAVAAPLTQAEGRVVDYLARNRETALLTSAAAMARSIGVSDATVIRTARKLGFSGLEEMRRALADDLRRDLTLSDRVANDLRRAGGGPAAVLAQTLGTLRETLDAIERLPAADLDHAVRVIAQARRLHVFGIGPSGHIAGYFAAQIARLGVEARALRNTGLQFADDLIGLSQGDALVALAYDRPYAEVTALFARATALRLASVLITSAGAPLPDHRAGLVLRVARGRADGFSLHAGTLALLEALLVGFAAADPQAARKSLDALNGARRSISGEGMGL